MMERITAEEVRKLLDYNPDTGALTWRARTPDMFREGKGRYTPERNCKIWNARYAGKNAGCMDGHGHVVVKIDYCRYQAHRVAFVIMTGEWPPEEVDHKNLDRANNAWENIRAASKAQNMQNVSVRSDNASGVKGVSFCKKSEKYEAYIHSGGKKKSLGYFVNLDAAAKRRRSAAIEAFGEFGREG